MWRCQCGSLAVPTALLAVAGAGCSVCWHGSGVAHMGVTLIVRRESVPPRTTSMCVKLSMRRSYARPVCSKLTWLVLGGDPAARSHRVEQFTALWGL